MTINVIFDEPTNRYWGATENDTIQLRKYLNRSYVHKKNYLRFKGLLKVEKGIILDREGKK